MEWKAGQGSVLKSIQGIRHSIGQESLKKLMGVLYSTVNKFAGMTTSRGLEGLKHYACRNHFGDLFSKFVHHAIESSTAGRNFSEDV